ncbi:MAG: hypothetical protein U9R79_19200 [Armatimonadota bacterium]|nr:hypothetical protein [Armatimonadota bacterium]
MLEIGHQRLDARPEGALRLQARWVLGLLVVTTMWAINLVAPGLDHHRPHRRYLHHLTGADFSAGQMGQVGAAIIAAGGPTLQRNVRLLTAAGVALMALLRPTFGVASATTVGLAALRGRDGGVGVVFGRPGEALNLRLQLGDAGLKLLNASLLKLNDLLLSEDDVNQFILRQLLELLAGQARHGCVSWCDGGCECKLWYSRQMSARKVPAFP